MKGASFATFGDLAGWPTEPLACHPKVRYKREEDAVGHMREIQRKAVLGNHKVRHPDQLNVFLCRHCGDFHVGHRWEAVALATSANRGVVGL